MARNTTEELIRARLAYLTAGMRAPGAPRRADESAPAEDSVPGPEPPPGPDRSERPSRSLRQLSIRHLAVIALLVLGGIVVTMTALSRSEATEVPVEVSAPAAATPSVASPAPVTLRVHVVGAVKHPGVVELADGAIVADALEAAGGMTKKADPALLNLAAPVTDGVQVVVGTEQAPAGELVSPGAGALGGTSGTQGRINLNQADQAALEELPGIGPVTAGAIISWREDNGAFTSVEELQEISGIGPKTFAKLKDLVQV